MARIVRLPNVKMIRAEVIRERLPKSVRRVLCLSCGNATAALARILRGMELVAVDKECPITAGRELSTGELHHFFGPDTFNATSGYLPVDWLETIGQRLLPRLPPATRYFVPCGSGETILALSFFVPLKSIVAVTALYPPIQMMGPLSRWLRGNVEVRDAGHVGSVSEALHLVARGHGVALCWE